MAGGETPGAATDETKDRVTVGEEAVADAAVVDPDNAAVLEEVDRSHTDRRELKGALTKPQAIEKDDEAAEALETKFEEAKAGLLDGLGKILATKDTNSGFLAGQVEQKVTGAKADISELGGKVDRQMDEASRLRGEGKFEEAKAALEEAQKAIVAQIEKSLKRDSSEGMLSDETEAALSALRELAQNFGDDLDTLFDARYKTVMAIAVAKEVTEETGEALAGGTGTGVQEQAPPGAETTPPPAVPSETLKRSLESKLQNPFGVTLSTLEATIQGFDTGFSWIGLSGDHKLKEAAKPKAIAAFGDLKRNLDSALVGIKTQTASGQYAAALTSWDLLKTDVIQKGIEAVKATLKAVPGTEVLIASIDESGRELEASVATLKTLTFEAGEAAKVELAAAKPAETTTPASDAATDAPTETTDEFDPEDFKKQVEDLKNSVIEAYSTKPPNMGLLFACAFQALGLVMSAAESGDWQAIGALVTEYFGGEKSGFEGPSDLLMAVFDGTNLETISEIRKFGKLTLKQLYDFHQDPEGDHSDIPEDVLSGLRALRADHEETYKKVIEQIFEKGGGKVGIDTDNGKRTVTDFVQEKLTKLAKGFGVKPEAEEPESE